MHLMKLVLQYCIQQKKKKKKNYNIVYEPFFYFTLIYVYVCVNLTPENLNPDPSPPSIPQKLCICKVIVTPKLCSGVYGQINLSYVEVPMLCYLQS